MQLVVDANILLAGFSKSATTRELLLDPRLQLFAPEHLLIETIRHVEHNTSLKKRIGLASPEIRFVFEQLTCRIQTSPLDEYSARMADGIRLAAHPEDAPYLALALWKRLPLWSNDKGMKLQSDVKVFTTAQLIAALSARS